MSSYVSYNSPGIDTKASVSYNSPCKDTNASVSNNGSDMHTKASISYNSLTELQKRRVFSFYNKQRWRKWRISTCILQVTGCFYFFCQPD